MQAIFANLKQRGVKILKLYLNDMKSMFFVCRFLMNFFYKLPGFKIIFITGLLHISQFTQ